MSKKLLVTSTILILIPVALWLSGIVSFIESMAPSFYILTISIKAMHVLAIAINVPVFVSVLLMWSEYRRNKKVKYFKKEEILRKDVYDAALKKVGYVKNWAYSPEGRISLIAFNEERRNNHKIPFDHIDRMGEFIILNEKILDEKSSALTKVKRPEKKTKEALKVEEKKPAVEKRLEKPEKKLKPKKTLETPKPEKKPKEALKVEKKNLRKVLSDEKKLTEALKKEALSDEKKLETIDKLIAQHSESLKRIRE